MRRGKVYGLNSLLEFGKYKYERLGDIIDRDISYIIWALNNVDIFALDEKAMSFLIQSPYSQCDMNRVDSRRLMSLINEKILRINESPIRRNTYFANIDDKPTYEKYGGSYAQDYEGLSDQIIDDVFEGDPDAYWNID